MKYISIFSPDEDYNLPILRDLMTNTYYSVYENPYLRDYFDNLHIKEGATFYKHKLTIDMAKEFPVPLPTDVEKNAQQKRFQNKKTVNALRAEQKALRNEMESKMKEIHLNRFNDLMDKRKLKKEAVFHIYDTSG